MTIKHFRTAADFRRWLAAHHDTATEIWIGFYKKDSGRTGMSYPEAVDQALCFGWIDGIRKKVDEVSYTNRFTPRTARSNWSLVNIRRVKELEAQGLMAAPGLAAFAARDRARSRAYSSRPKALAPELEEIFRTKKRAWAFWEAQPPGYRRTVTWWVMSAVKDETRRERLARLMAEAAKGRRVGLLSPAGTGEPR